MSFQALEETGSKAQDSIASVLAPVHVPPEERMVVRYGQLQSVDRFGIVMVLANLLSAGLILLIVTEGANPPLLSLWGVAVFMLSGLTFLRLSYRTQNPQAPRRIRRDIYRYTLLSGGFGMVWALLPLIAIPVTDDFGRITVSLVLASMVYGSSLTLARLPMAAVMYMAPVTTALVWSLLQYTELPTAQVAALVVMYIVVTAVSVRWNYNQFLIQHMTQNAVSQQNALIGLLLRDFDESTSDWLWQTNARGDLIDIPMSLKGEKTGFGMMRQGVHLLDLFADGEPRNILAVCLERRTGFRDLVLEVDNGDGRSFWWSLTGKPLMENGVLIGFRGVASDVTASKEIEDRIAYMAHYDGLTGLLNRTSFQERLERICGRKSEDTRVKAVVLMDLDNFKWVNDTLGHGAGDELLRQLGARLGDETEPRDIVARLGGDEFALILTRESKRALRDSLDDLIEALDAPYDLWGSTANCGASLGVRIFRPGKESGQTLLSQADLALYQAKHKGKGNWCRFTSDLEANAQARRLIEQDLHAAFSRDELYLEFQPIMSADTSKIVACETLVRWQHPTRGVIMPSEFIQHAEDCGLITRLGEWVIRSALAEARRLPQDVRLSVNISPLQLHSSSLISTIVNALAHNQIAPHRLDLEITESVLLSDSEFVMERLAQLRKLGLSLSLDDFGTGFSSLSYLRAFPFDKIKIDKSFVSDMDTNEDSRVITRATVSLAKSLGLKSTAEGVETESQKQFLTALGCDEIQGYCVSQPRRLEDLEHLISLSPAQNEGESSRGDILQVAANRASALIEPERRKRTG
ncbi:MAG: EAL domain-containing protein [Hyphomonadaceae bacterium]|nr:EAL domain-containing protein [Hyphomonadaceae bacterium]